MDRNILSDQKPVTRCSKGPASETKRNQRITFYFLLSTLYSAIRYRFFLIAGIFPYILGQIIAFNIKGSLDLHYFWWGFLGIIFTLTSVELFNEYFDAQTGGDRIFSKIKTKVSVRFLHFGFCSILCAFFIAFYLAFHIGWPIFVFSFLGFLGAYFYVGSPIKWSYRGLGEIVIALCYGPLMVLGSYYLQIKRIDFVPFFASLICGLSLFCLAILNEIPDYYQDRLVGKRNLVVRLGKQKSIRFLFLILACLFILLALGVICEQIPLLGLVSFFSLPWIIKSLVRIKKNYENPKSFILAINTNIVIYLIIMFSLGIGFLGRGK